MAEALKPGVRVTLEMGEQPQPHRIESGPLGRGVDALAGSVVLPSDPHAKSGTYWGYTVRIASGLSAVFSGCPYQVCRGQQPGCAQTSAEPGFKKVVCHRRRAPVTVCPYR